MTGTTLCPWKKKEKKKHYVPGPQILVTHSVEDVISGIDPSRGASPVPSMNSCNGMKRK